MKSGADLIFCRACEQHIRGSEWIPHVGKHKKDYNAALGNNPRCWRRMNWDDVIKWVKTGSLANFAPPLTIKRGQRNISEYQKKEASTSCDEMT